MTFRRGYEEKQMCRDLLLVIDMQNVYAEGGQWYCPHSAGASENILRILEKKQETMDVIFTEFRASENPEGVWKQYNRENEQVNQDSRANELMEVFRDAMEKYPLYTKSVYSSMAIPEVREAAFRSNQVVISGVVAECCVLATVMSLIDAGIPVIYLTDAVAGIDSDTEAAVELVLAGLEPLHVRRMTTEEYLTELRK